MLIILFLTTVLPGRFYGLEVGSGLGSGDEVDANLCVLSHGVFSDPDSCSVFIRCRSGEPKVDICSDGLIFNPLKLTCDFSKSGNCSDFNDFETLARVETNDVACSVDGPNIYPIRGSCTEYYICENNTAFKVKCPIGLLMNAEKMTCDYSENVDCDVVSKTEDSTIGITVFYENNGDEFETDTETFFDVDKSFTQSAETIIHTKTETDFYRKNTNKGNISSNTNQNLRAALNGALMTQDYFDFLESFSGDAEIDSELPAEDFDGSGSISIDTEVDLKLSTGGDFYSSESISGDAEIGSKKNVSDTIQSETSLKFSTIDALIGTSEQSLSVDFIRTTTVLDELTTESSTPDIQTYFLQNAINQTRDGTIEDISKVIFIDENEPINNTYGSQTEDLILFNEIAENTIPSILIDFRSIETEPITSESTTSFKTPVFKADLETSAISTLSSDFTNSENSTSVDIEVSSKYENDINSTTNLISYIEPNLTAKSLNSTNENESTSNVSLISEDEAILTVPSILQTTDKALDPFWPEIENFTAVENLASISDTRTDSIRAISSTEISVVFMNDTTETAKINTDYSDVSIISRHFRDKNDDAEYQSISYPPAVLQTEITNLPSNLAESTYRGVSLTDGLLDISTTLNPVCKTLEGNFPYPDDCRMFYHCRKGIPVASLCVGDEHFDPVKRICENPCLAKCDLNADCSSTESTNSVEEITSQTTLSGTNIPSDLPFTETEETSFVTTTNYFTEKTSLKISGSFSEDNQTKNTVSHSTIETTAGKDWTDSLASLTLSSSGTDINVTNSVETISDFYVNTTYTEQFTDAIDSNSINLDVLIKSKKMYKIASETQTEAETSSTIETSTETFSRSPSESSEIAVNIDSTLDSNSDWKYASLSTSIKCEDERCISKLSTSTLVPLRLCHRNDFLPLANCNEYLDCTSDVPIKLACPMGLHFNPTTRVCDWPYKVECGTLPKPLFETTNLFSCACKSCLISSTTNCSEYYLCIGFTAYKMNCSYNLNFDRNMNTCNYAHLVGCNHLTSSSTTEIGPTENSTKTSTEFLFSTTESPSTKIAFFICPSREGRFRYPGNCGMYYHCSNWYPYAMQCAANTHFSKVTTRCEYPCDAKCDRTLNCGSPLTFSTNPWCPEPNGMFPHKDNCRKFVHCSNSIPYIKDCPSILEYDPVKKLCEWPSGRCPYLPVRGKKLDAFKTEKKRKDWRCPKAFGYFSDDKHCNKFYHCSFGMPALKECSPGLSYNSRYQTCDWENNTQCNSNRLRRAKRCHKFDHHVVCLDDRKPLPHVLCNMYFDCTKGRACAKKCPIGLYFNNLTGLCDLPENAKCFNSKNESEE